MFFYNVQKTPDHFPKTIKGKVYSNGNPVYHIIDSWIDNLERRDEYLDYFFDCDPIHDKTVVLIRLQEFLDSYNLTVDMDEIKKYARKDAQAEIKKTFHCIPGQIAE